MEDDVLVAIRRICKCKKGQSRILEAVIAAVIIFIVFSAATFLIRSSDTGVLQERADLDRLGYNLLNRLVESGTIESMTHTNPTDEEVIDWTFNTTIQKSLPSTVYFNLTIFKCNEISNYPLNYTRIDFVTCASDAPSDLFKKSREVSSTTLLYTSKSGSIFYLVLSLARAGGADQ
ncbi:MAG TPA: hypothetical protein VJ507_03425 [Candidatus Bathyarchaeia archaeon]|nr:hypothetical protein [Candidatus Bathyarchaeia archaeon]